MAKLQFVDLTDLTTFRDLLDADHATKLTNATKDSIKSASVSADGYTLYLYKTASPKSEDEAAYSFALPNPTGKADKVSGATNGHLAGLDASGNLTDSGKSISDFDAAGAAQTVDDKYSSMVGNLPSQYSSVVDMITKTVASGVYDDTEVKQNIQANADAIGVLNGEGTGSVKKQVADAVASIVADAPDSYDTLKEISDWITNHSSDAAGMNSQINTNKEDIAALAKLLGELPSTATATTVVGYIAEAVANAITDLNMSQYATTTITDALATRVGALESADTQLQADIDANEAAISALDTSVSASLASMQTSVDSANSNADSAKATAEANSARLTTLEGLVGDGVEAIPVATIQGLFTTT